MVVVVLAAQVVDVGGADQRAAHLAGEPDDRLVGLLLLGEPVALDLEVDLLGAEGLDEVVEMGAGVVGAPLDDPPVDPRLQAAGERDHPLGVGGQALHVDGGLAAVQALEEAGRGQLDEVAVARVVGRQQRQVVALDLPRRAVAAVVDEVDLAAEDRLDAVLGGTPCASSTAPFITPWSVRPSAGCPSSAARAASASILQAPSSSEYSEWTWRCAQAAVLTGERTLGAGPDGPGGLSRTLRVRESGLSPAAGRPAGPIRSRS